MFLWIFVHKNCVKYFCSHFWFCNSFCHFFNYFFIYYCETTQAMFNNSLYKNYTGNKKYKKYFCYHCLRIMFIVYSLHFALLSSDYSCCVVVMVVRWHHSLVFPLSFCDLATSETLNFKKAEVDWVWMYVVEFWEICVAYLIPSHCCFKSQ